MDTIDLEIKQKIDDRKLKNVVVKTIRKKQIENFMVKSAIAAITAMYAANAYVQVSNLNDKMDRKKAMKSVIEQDWTILNDKNNRYEGLIDEKGYPRGWGYNHQNIAERLNQYYALSKDLGDIHLADIADLIEYDENNQNIDKVFNWIDDQYVGEAKNFADYYQSLGFNSEEEYYQAMVDLNYEKSMEENLGGPKL